MDYLSLRKRSFEAHADNVADAPKFHGLQTPPRLFRWICSGLTLL
jgi:hypothetical protein